MPLLLTAILWTVIAPVHAPEPNRQPALTSAPGLTALVFGSGHSIWFSASRDNGHTFSKPVEVAQVPVLALGRHRGPRVIISGRTTLVSAVYGRTAAMGPHAHGLPFDGDLIAWRSTDGGKSWSKPVVINDVPGSAREGLHAIASGNNNELAAVWLDLRSSGTQLYGSYSIDAGATWSRNMVLYKSPAGTICQCCAPSIVFSGEHRSQVMFRNVQQGARDMYLVDWNFNDPISTPQKLGAGSWKIDACPMDGGGLAHQGNTTLTAWRRAHTVYLEKPGQKEVALGEGKDISLALSAKGPYVAWANPSGVSLHEPGNPTPLCLSSKGSFPALTNLSNGNVLAAWEQDGAIQVRVIQ